MFFFTLTKIFFFKKSKSVQPFPWINYIPMLGKSYDMHNIYVQPWAFTKVNFLEREKSTKFCAFLA